MKRAMARSRRRCAMPPLRDARCWHLESCISTGLGLGGGNCWQTRQCVLTRACRTEQCTPVGGFHPQGQPNSKPPPPPSVTTGSTGCLPQLADWLARPPARRSSAVPREMCEVCSCGIGRMGVRPLLAGLEGSPQALRSEAVPADLLTDLSDLPPPTKGSGVWPALRRLGSGHDANCVAESGCVLAS